MNNNYKHMKCRGKNEVQREVRQELVIFLGATEVQKR